MVCMHVMVQRNTSQPYSAIINARDNGENDGKILVLKVINVKTRVIS